MDATQIKTRHGLILEGLTAHALIKAGFSYRKNWQYDESAEVPDFFLPDSDNPTHVFEVHQTDARDSFRMKTLRAFTAVMEAKSHFGDEIISVNILFGDPDTEVPQANVNALCGFFDLNIIPRNAAKNPALIIALEDKALEYASDEDVNVEEAVQQVASQVPKGVAELADILKRYLPKATRNAALDPLWQMERNRTKKLGDSPTPGPKTYYKRTLLKSVYLSDEQFAELFATKDPDKWSPSLQRQLIATKLVEVTEGIDGDHLVLETTFRDFLSDAHAVQLRDLCKQRLDEEPAMKWFFEDIRDSGRREHMAEVFLQYLLNGKDMITEALETNLSNDYFSGINHKRSWIADLLALTVEASQNEFNKRMVQTNRDPQNYQYPFSHITGKFERLLNNPGHFGEYSKYSVETYEQICSEKHLPTWNVSQTKSQLADKLLNLRLDGAVKLQRFSPLDEVLRSEAMQLGIQWEQVHAESIIYDLAGAKGRLGKYDVTLLKKDNKIVMAVSVAVHDHNGDHKSKEWGARRRAMLCRLKGGVIKPAEIQDALFVLDGEWEPKDVQRLYRSGWNRICRLSDLEATLKDIFK